MGNKIIKDQNRDDDFIKKLILKPHGLTEQDQLMLEGCLDLKKYLKSILKQRQELEINQIIFINKQIRQISEINEAQIEGSANEVEEFQIKINNITQILRAKGYETVKFIGKGSFGMIFLCKLSTSGIRYVIKAQRPFSKDPIQHQQYLVELAFEIEALSTFNDCKNVVQYLGHEIDVESHYSFIKLQECKGTLQDILNLNKKINEKSFIKYAQDIIKGIEEIHQKNFVIQDLKPDNIFIDLNDKALIGDLGLSKKLKEGKSNLSIAQGNFSYFAPEQLPMYIQDMLQFGIKQNNSHLSSDIYSFGLILYRLLCKQDKDIFQRFQTKCQVDPENLIQQFKFKNEIKEIIMKCTSFNPYERPTASEVSHYFKKLQTHIFTIEYKDLNLLMRFQKHAKFFEIQEFIQNSLNTIIPVIINESQIQEQISNITNKIISLQKNKVFRIVLLGDQYVGKSTHLNSITQSKFIPAGFTIGSNSAYIQFQVDDFIIKLSIFDIAGVQQYRSIEQQYCKGQNGYLLYLTDDTRHIDRHIQYIQIKISYIHAMNYVLPIKNCQLVLIQWEQQQTLEQKLVISKQIKQLQEWASENYNIILNDPIEVHLRNNYNVDLPLENLLRNILKYQFGYKAKKLQKIQKINNEF